MADILPFPTDERPELADVFIESWGFRDYADCITGASMACREDALGYARIARDLCNAERATATPEQIRSMEWAIGELEKIADLRMTREQRRLLYGFGKRAGS